MPIVGFAQTFLEAGTINTTHSFSAQHNFAAPGLTVWSYPALQSIGINDDDASVGLRISKFTDKNGAHDVNFSGLFAEKCTSITFRMRTTDCIVTALLTTHIFG